MFFTPVECFAAKLIDGTGKEAIDYYKAQTVTHGGNDSIKHTKSMIGAIINLIQVVGLLIAVIMLMVLGIKYMFSSPDERAQIKKYALTYVLGAIILFGASGIVYIIKNFVLDNTKNITV